MPFLEGEEFCGMVASRYPARVLAVVAQWNDHFSTLLLSQAWCVFVQLTDTNVGVAAVSAQGNRFEDVRHNCLFQL